MTFHPYSDFLLRALGDSITQNNATGKLMRTAPLWGLRKVTTYLHDGRATILNDAILAHDGQGRKARDRFAALPTIRKRGWWHSSIRCNRPKAVQGAGFR